MLDAAELLLELAVAGAGLRQVEAAVGSSSTAFGRRFWRNRSVNFGLGQQSASGGKVMPLVLLVMAAGIEMN